MRSVFDCTISDLEEYFTNIGEAKYKARQVYEWIYRKRIFDFDEMSNLKKDLREKLKTDFSCKPLKIEKVQSSSLTKKYLFRLDDGNYIEAVLMIHDYGRSVCVSSQVGCNMGCRFCESGRLKKVRNLESGEIVRQLLAIEEVDGKRIDSVVIMGIGEPFDNYENIMRFIEIINSPYGIAVGARHITVSTCGLVPKILEYADNGLQTNLAISLHAPNNLIRDELMPINKVYNIESLIKSIDEYIKKTNRRVTIEYVMLNNVNDSVENANELADLLRGLNVYVNLIPYNETSHLQFKKSDKTTILKFYDALKKRGINVTIRKEFGRNIDAACGQLRASEVEK